MKRVAALTAAALLVSGAKTNDMAGFLLAVGVVVALLVVLGLPLGLLLHTHCRDWVAAEARAIERRATACVLIGAGLVTAALFVVALLAPRAPWLAVAAAAAATAWFLVGFTGCARRQGERMTGAGAGNALVRPLVVGWLARAGLFAVPVIWPLLGAYLVVAAFGAPVVAMLERRAPPPVT